MVSRLIRAALFAFPAADRARQGAEMADTLRDASAGSRSRLAFELAGLVRLGLRTRARRVAEPGVGRVLADGIGRGATWIMILDLSTLVVQRLRGLHDPLLGRLWILTLIAVLAVSLVGFDRLGGLAALLWTATRIPLLSHSNDVTWIAPTLWCVAAFAVLAILPRRRRPDPRRLGWLLVPAYLISVFGLSPRNDGTVFMLMLATVVVIVGAAAVSLPIDPRLAIAASLPITYIGLTVIDHIDGNWVSNIGLLSLLSASPVILAVAVARYQRLNQE